MNNANTINILLIEDELRNGEFIQHSLHSNLAIDCRLTWVKTLKAAKQQLTQHSFHLLLLDLALPDSSGLATLNKVQMLTRDSPIIVLISQNKTNFSLKLLEMGVADYLVKGDFSQDSLFRSIRYSLQLAKIEQRNLLLVAALKAADNSIVITDRKAIIKWASPAFTKLAGYTLDEVIEHNAFELIKPALKKQTDFQKMWKTLLAGKSWSGEIVNQGKDKEGYLYHEQLTISPVFNKTGIIEHFIGIKENISPYKQMAKLQALADTDALTGLFNRRVFLKRLQEEIERLNRCEQHSATLLMLDLDRFKQINDNYGHVAGDKVLCCCADILTASLRSIDLSARLGGEEFAVLLPSTKTQSAFTLAERLRLNIAKSFIESHAKKIHFTVSIGIAALSNEDNDYRDVLHRADTALYQAKNKGRNQSCLFISA